MPEFVLNTHGAGAPWESLDAFTQGFIEAAFFSSSSCYPAAEFFTPEAQERVREGQADGDLPSDSSVAQIDRDSFCRVKDFCDGFQGRAAALLTEAYATGDYDESQAGRDLYFTYAGHGVGYWERKALESRSDEWAATRVPLDQWTPETRALVARLEAESIGNRLSEACGRGEINLSAYEASANPEGFLVEFYIG